MKYLGVIAFAIAFGSTGCTTVALERYTLNQIHTSGECRDSTVLNCLTTVAAEPDTLPSFSLYGDGSTTVQDQFALSSTTSWTRAVNSFAMEILGATVTRNPKGQWTISPILEHERLEALHAACLWTICGPERANEDHPGILGYHLQHLDQKPHFGVEERLSKLPKGWLHVGCLKEVPLCALYKGHAGGTWVWVMPEDSESFAQFTLVLQDIATLALEVIYAPPLLVTLTRYGVTMLPDIGNGANKETISYNETRVIKPEYKAEIEKLIRQGTTTTGKVDITWAQWMAYTEPYLNIRTAPTVVSLPGTSSAGQQLPAAPSIPGRNLPAPLSRPNFQE